MRFHDLVFFAGQPAGFAQNGVVDTDLADVVKRAAQLDQFELIVGQFQLLGEHDRVARDALRVVAGVVVAKFDRLREYGHRLEELFLLLAQKLGGLDRGRDVRGQRVGQVKVIFGECVLPEAAIEVQDTESLARGPQQHAHHAGHRAVGDALCHLGFIVGRESAVEERDAAAKTALRELLGVMKAARWFALSHSQRPQPHFRFRSVAFSQYDRPSLRLQHADGVVEDRIEELILALHIHEVVAGAKQRESCSPARGI